VTSWLSVPGGADGACCAERDGAAVPLAVRTGGFAVVGNRRFPIGSKIAKRFSNTREQTPFIGAQHRARSARAKRAQARQSFALTADD
jgi:hypothetical protein